MTLTDFFISWLKKRRQPTPASAERDRATDKTQPDNNVEAMVANLKRLEEAQNIPLVQEAFAEPILLSKEPGVHASDFYAVGFGTGGIIVEVRNRSGESGLIPLISFTTHNPQTFKKLDMELVQALNDKSPWWQEYRKKSRTG